ncbi:orotidine 5'-phosphate decarboxylase / HUMPS family protein [Caldivirga sp. UBA161]|uniref:orotidine 5'-phosphate decarboxylase / HUMPS family protein n=1 Tax=Caldivirga sp. UBA161 TaxID=1915569 RepID=UPI0025BE7413|nr:orotidine 5'-phosphate decarboxylase / HUMPS family protein [Caldivirga sp. UBA161]
MKLQVALDLTNLDTAVDLARRLYGGGLIDVIEVGTPLIKAYGMYAVSRMRVCCPSALVFADLKTMDAGRIEVRLASENGANMASVLAAAPVDTIREFSDEARKLGLSTVVDFIGVINVEDRVKEVLNAAKVDYIGLHVGIDVQDSRKVTAEVLIDEVESIKRKYNVGVTLAGGVDARTALKLRGRDIDIIVVGRAITTAEKPEDAAREIRRNLGLMQ